MNEENTSGVSPLEDIDYVPQEKKKGAPTDVSAPVLDDIEYVAPSAKKGAPTGVSAPVLDDDNYVPPTSAKKGAPTGVSAPVLDDGPQNFASTKSEQKVLSDDDIIAGLTPDLKARFDALPEAQQRQVIEMRRSQLGAVAPVQESAPITAPVLDEPDAFVPPPKKEEPKAPAEPVSAPILDDEPETPEYKPQFVDEDLERVKREAKKKAVSAQLVSNQKDEKESLRMMMALKEERAAELAKKGFGVTIAVAVIGVIAAVAFYLLYTGAFGTGYKDTLGGFSKIIDNSAIYIAVAAGLCSVSLISGMGGLKSLTMFVFVLFAGLQLFPGLAMLPQHKNMKIAGVLFAVALICTIAVIVVSSASEAMGKYFNRNKSSHYYD